MKNDTSAKLYIKEWCAFRAKSQEDLAETAEMTPSQVSRIINQKSVPRASSLRKIATALDLSSVEKLYSSPFEKALA